MLKLHTTQWPDVLAFTMQKPGLWRFVDVTEGATPNRFVGPQYPTKAALLADANDYAQRAWGL